MIRMPHLRRRKRPRGFAGRALDVALAIAILGLLALIAMRFETVGTRQAQGRAVVNDGDTLTLAGERMRLRGIDAPEYGQTCRKAGAGYPCGRQARQFLAGLIGDRPVACEGWERDRYGRLLANCSIGGADLARSMVEAGWAVAYGDFEDVERAARQNGAGMWGGEFDRPRQWREANGKLAESEHDVIGRIANWLRSMLGWSASEPLQPMPGGDHEAI